MKDYRAFTVCIFLIFLFAACKQKPKPSMKGEEKVEVSDFIDFFQPIKLPCMFTDSVLLRKEKDSLIIGNKVFMQFVPDSLLIKEFGKGVKPKIYSLGKVEVSKAETYLFVKAITNEKKIIYLLSFDKKKKFSTGMVALRLDQHLSTTQSVSMDTRYTISKIFMRKNSDGSMSDGKDVYILNIDAGNFMLIMTDALEDKATEMINPIDTLPRKNKFSADYFQTKMNLVSIRDGRKNDRVSFFVHIEKDNGDCTGELKGEAMFRSANLAEYKASGDACILNFIFSPSSVSIKETNCGSHRGLQCLFDGSFTRKKEVKLKTAIKK